MRKSEREGYKDGFESWSVGCPHVEVKTILGEGDVGGKGVTPAGILGASGGELICRPNARPFISIINLFSFAVTITLLNGLDFHPSCPVPSGWRLRRSPSQSA